MTTEADILQAIRHKCLDCSNFQPGEVRECPVTRCGLWPYRFGRDPAPAVARGCAKPSLPRGGSSDDGTDPTSGTGRRRGIGEPLLGRTDSAEEAAVFGEGTGEGHGHQPTLVEA